MYPNETNENGKNFDLFNINTGINQMPSYIFVYVIMYGCASLIGTVGNSLVITTMVISKVLRQSRNAFIVSLAIADLMVSSITMPASIAGVILGKSWYEERTFLCSFTAIFCAPGCVASVYSMMCIAVSRYYYIGQYPMFNKYFSPARIMVQIVIIWIISYGVHLPNKIGWGRTRYSFMLRFCTLDTDLYSYAWFYASVILFAIIVSFIFYLKIYLTIRKSKLSKTRILGRVNQNHQSHMLSSEIKIVKTSFKIFVLFFVTWSPLTILFLLQLGEKVPPWAYLYAAFLAHGNSTLNFIVYFLENDMFRHALKEIFHKLISKSISVKFSSSKNNVKTVSIKPLKTVTPLSYNSITPVFSREGHV